VADGLDARVQDIVTALLQGGPKSQAAAKDLIRAVADRPVGDDLVEDTARRIASLRATPKRRRASPSSTSVRRRGCRPRAVGATSVAQPESTSAGD
jgi:methylglutaconyl-CoA hydratase